MKKLQKFTDFAITVDYLDEVKLSKNELAMLKKEGYTEYFKLYDDDKVLYYSGYMNQATCMQDVDALDIRNMEVREECKYLFDEVVKEIPLSKQSKIYTDPLLIRSVSIAFSKKIREKGYLILFDPNFKKQKERK
jgi:hypothetical protein